MGKTTDLALVLDDQIAFSLIQIVQHKVHRGEQQGECNCRQDVAVELCVPVK
jgi:hypothetical protein